MNVCNGIVVALDEQDVRWYYWCMFEYECPIAWYTTMHTYCVYIMKRYHPKQKVHFSWYRNSYIAVCLGLNVCVITWCAYDAP